MNKILETKKKGLTEERKLKKRGRQVEEDIKTMVDKQVEEDFPPPTSRGASSEEEEEEEIELPPEDTQADERALFRYAQAMRLKKSKCPKGHYICRDPECEYTNEVFPTLLNHMINVHKHTQHSDKAEKDLKIYKENQKDIEKQKEKQKEEERIAKEIENRELIQQTIDQLGLQIKETEIKKETNDSTQANASLLQIFLNWQKARNKEKEEGNDKDSENQKNKKEKEQKKKKEKNSKDQEDKKKKEKQKNSKRDEDEEDNKDKPPPKTPSERGRGKGDPSDGDDDDSSSSSSSSSDEDNKEKKDKGPTKKQPIKKLNFNWEDYIKPDCLDTENNPRMKYFVRKTALTRNDLSNEARAYGEYRNRPQRAVLVAPIFPKTYKRIFKELGMQNIPTAELAAWFMAYLEARTDPEWGDDEVRLQVLNDFEQLSNSPKDKRIKLLQEEAPKLRGKSDIQKMSTEDIKKWMHAGRRYCLDKGIWWKFFQDT